MSKTVNIVIKIINALIAGLAPLPIAFETE